MKKTQPRWRREGAYLLNSAYHPLPEYKLPKPDKHPYRPHILQTAHNEWYKHGPDHFFSENTPRLRPSRLKHLLKLRRYWERVK